METGSGEGTTQRNQHRTRQERRWLLGAFLALALLLALSRWQAWHQVGEAEGKRLLALAVAAEVNMARRLDAAHAALTGVRDDRAQGLNMGVQLGAERRMRAVKQAMPGVRQMALLDAQGRVQASTGDPAEVIKSLPADFMARQARQADPDMLRIDVPANLVPAQGLAALVSVSVWGEPGSSSGSAEFNGVVLALLEDDYLMSAMTPLLYAPDMLALVAHGNGVLLALAPAQPGRIGTNLNSPQSLFTRHRQAGGGAGVQQALSQLYGVERIAALQDLAPRRARLEQPLVLALSRDPRAVHAAWQRQTWLQALVLGALMVLARLGWGAQQRRRAQQAAREALAEREQVLQAERLELALAGADLALWDSDLRTGRAVVNARWFQMLGVEDGAFDPQSGWAPRVHPDDLAAVRLAEDEHLAGDTPGFETSYRIRHAQGHWVWVLARGRVVERAADGRALRMVGTQMDVTALMQAQDALRSSEQNLAITLNSIGDGVITTDTEGRIERMNPAAERLTGWTLTAAQGLPLPQVFSIYNARTRQAVTDPVALVLAHGRVVELTNNLMLVARDGSERHIADSAAPIRAPQRAPVPGQATAAGNTRRDPPGDILGVVLVFSDVTEQYHMLQVLRDRERQFASVAEALPGPVSRVDAQGRYLYANRIYESWFGLPPSDIIGRTQREVLGEECWADVAAHVQRALGGEQVQYESPLRTVTGERLHVLVSLIPDHDDTGAPAGFFAVGTDITERKRAEEELRRSESRLRLAVRIARLGGWRLERASLRFSFTPETLLILYPDHSDAAIAAVPEAFDAALGLVEPADRERMRAALLHSLETGTAFDQQLLVNSSNRQRCLRMLGAAERDSSGRVLALQGAVQDITEVQRDISQRQQAEAGLREAQQALQATLAAVPDLLFEMDLEGRVISQHSPRGDLLFQAPERFLGQRVQQVLPADAASAMMDALRQAHEHGRSTGRQYSLLLPEGRRCFELSVSSKPTPPDQVPRFIALARDITDRKRAEEDRQTLERQLREAQKMESIGTLAGGIAHDFNNILAAILGNVALARHDLPAGHSALASLDQIQRAGQRARSLVQQILTFSRRDPQTLTVQPLRALVEETLGLLRATLPAGVRVDLKLADAPLSVLADATQLPQVLMNLCTNAWHALPDSQGRIEIGLEQLAAGDPRRAELGARHAVAGLQPLPEGACAHLWVRDDGKGMDAAVRQRIFDPFFTTKPVGHGTGLGLSVVHGIVNTLHGAIRVDSAPGQGTAFHVFLPLASAAEPTATAAVMLDNADLSTPGGASAGRVLYVDDDEVMVLMVQRLLQRAGHQVLACSDAQQALALLRDPAEKVDVLVTDFNMPELSGLDLCRQTRALRPGLPMVISSGYISERLRVGADALAVSALLKKENTLDELPGLVRQLLPHSAA